MPESHPSCSRGTIRGNVLVVDILLEQIRDPESSYALRDEILSLMKAGEIEHVVIDLKGVTFLGSVGLLAFLAVRRQLADGKVLLCNVADGIRTMLEICLLVSKDPGKTAPFQVEPSVEAALARLA